MKLRIIASSLLILLLSIAVNTNADAQRWRGCRRDYCRPHYGARIWAPVPVIAPPVYVGGYYGPRYCPPAYCAPRYYHRPYYGGYRQSGRRYCR